MKLTDLADAAGVSPRTVRYYVQRGLLPAPVFRGKDTEYGKEHLERLKAIRKLQDQYLPLDAIQAVLEGKNPPKIAAAAPVKVETRGERWERYPLAPGVELHVKDDPEAQRFARRILGGGHDDER